MPVWRIRAIPPANDGKAGSRVAAVLSANEPIAAFDDRVYSRADVADVVTLFDTMGSRPGRTSAG
jgi:hypothetical protein